MEKTRLYYNTGGACCGPSERIRFLETKCGHRLTLIDADLHHGKRREGKGQMSPFDRLTAMSPSAVRLVDEPFGCEPVERPKSRRSGPNGPSAVSLSNGNVEWDVGGRKTVGAKLLSVF